MVGAVDFGTPGSVFTETLAGLLGEALPAALGAALQAALVLAAAFFTAFLAAALAASKLPFLTIAETKEKTEEAKEFQVERI